jgi:hypothetical protein
MEEISDHVATIQNLAAQLTEAQSDQQKLDSLLTKIMGAASTCSLSIEDIHSRMAKYYFKKLNCSKIRLSSLACYIHPEDSRLPYKMRTVIQAGLFPAVKEDCRYFATVETLAEYFRQKSESFSRRQKAA